MARQITRTNQSFEQIVSKDCFYVDKTRFIADWWQSYEQVTLITRPRRFGKSMALSMVERFFSIRYEGKPEIFSRLAIATDSKMMEEQGKYPVISLSLAGCTGSTYDAMLVQLSAVVRKVFEHVEEDLGLGNIKQRDIAYMERILEERFDRDGNPLPLSKDLIIDSLNRLSLILYRKYSSTKVIILLDEYDTPLENAYLHGYWDQAASFFEEFYKNTFKLNTYLGRALIIGITIIPKESLISPFNNAAPCSVFVPSYEDSFGFTQEEVDAALAEYEMADMREKTKEWYDGYQFGRKAGMYNPMSICLMLSEKEFKAYWANSASNEIVSHVVKGGSNDLKDRFAALMQGGTVEGRINETITYKTLRSNRETIWGLLLSCGYLKVLGKKEDWYTLSIVNHEVRRMMDGMAEGWFKTDHDDKTYPDFIDALVECSEAGMQRHLSTLLRSLAGSFDTARGENGNDLENFYHGLMLGIVGSLRNRFLITSNRESGDGRYDVMMEPRDKERDNGIIIEFKVFNPEKEKDLEGTCQRALEQIELKHYDTELKRRGVPDNRIAKFGIGFMGKDVLVKKLTGVLKPASTQRKRKTSRQERKRRNMA